MDSGTPLTTDAADESPTTEIRESDSPATETPETDSSPRVDADPDVPTTRPAVRRKTARRKRRRKPITTSLIVTHRWLSIVLGAVLVVVCTSGAILVYAPELTRMTNADKLTSTPTDNPVTFGTAIASVKKADPDFDAAYISLKDGVYFVSSAQPGAGTWFVDAGSGKVNAHGDLNGGVLGFLVNLHDCGLTCEDYPGYIAWLASPSPIADWGWYVSGMTWGAVILALSGLLLVFLAISGVIIWWPGLRRLRSRFRVRIGKGRFARDYDLHNIIGIVAAIPLLIWGLTGMNFETPGLAKTWYSATGGIAPPEDNYSMPPSTGTGPMMSVDQAIDAATARYPGSKATWVGMPSDATGFYSVDVLADGPDLWAHSATYHANREVGVDSHDPTKIAVFNGESRTLSNTIIDDWAQPTLHYGVSVNAWWRLFWFVLGMAPLLLFLTGLSTWQFRLRTTRRRRAARKTSAST
ncbi:PepSY-associated TM helix domain-containing protein [Gordonia aichiensis]|nr:PepSY-associated TM helix domain-containing protein [Gordonia aichiensis]